MTTKTRTKAATGPAAPQEVLLPEVQAAKDKIAHMKAELGHARKLEETLRDVSELSLAAADPVLWMGAIASSMKRIAEGIDERGSATPGETIELTKLAECVRYLAHDWGYSLQNSGNRGMAQRGLGADNTGSEVTK